MRILVKIGSALISQNAHVNYNFLRTKVAELSALQKAGHKIILVTSGAVAAGMEIKGLTTRPKDTLTLQMLSGIGQVKLIKYYKEFFQENGEFIAQVLVTHHNFDKENEVQTLVSVLNAYLADNVIPIINENDLVDKRELESSPIFTDNDILSAVVATKLGVDLTVLLTDVDGLYEDNPKNNPSAKFFFEIDKITDEVVNMASHGKSDLGLGGMLSKIEAAKMITAKSIPVIISNGNNNICDIIDGKVKRTYFKVED